MSKKRERHFWVPDSLSHFPMGRTLTPCKHRRFPLQLMGNKCPWLIHSVLSLMPLRENEDVRSEKTTPHMLYSAWIFTAHIFSWELMLKSFPLLSAGQPRDGRMETDHNPPWIIQVWTQPESDPGLQKNFDSCFRPGEANAPFLLQGSWGCRALASGAGGGMQWALCYYPLLNFLLGVKQPVEEDRSINFIAGLISAIN